ADGAAEDLAAGFVRARRLALRLLRHHGRAADARPRGPEEPRRGVGLGERGYLVRAVQPSQGRPAFARGLDGAAPQAAAARAGAVHPAGRAEDPRRLAAVPDRALDRLARFGR